MNNYISIEGRYYGISLPKLISYCEAEANTINTITQSYVQNNKGHLCLESKDITETSESTNETLSNVRFNLITNILNLVLMPVSDGNGVIITEDLSNMHLGQKLAFNTMLATGIIYEIDIKEI